MLDGIETFFIKIDNSNLYNTQLIHRTEHLTFSKTLKYSLFLSFEL